MTPRSLRARLLLLATISTLLLLAAAGFSFHQLFQRHVESYARSELALHFDELLANLEVDAAGKIRVVRPLSDPRFEQPGGGLYWQVDPPSGQPLRSRSLWEEHLTVPPIVGNDDAMTTIKGPSGSTLLAIVQEIALDTPQGGDIEVEVVVAQDRSGVANAVSSFAQDMFWGLGALAIALVAASLAIILLGLRPLGELKSEIERLRRGQVYRISTALPAEVHPLTQEINELMEAREKQLERARQRAGNLAHGLKTPLTVLASIASDLESDGDTEISEQIALTTGQMRDLVDRELARSRMAAGASTHRTLLLPHVQRIVDALKRAPKGQALDWKISVPTETTVAIDAVDLLELLGNLAENASKHAKGLVAISHDGAALVVEDDGAGVPPEKIASISRRGVKLDSLAAGSGLGLAIVTDLAEAYDFPMAFDASPLGGLRVKLGLPALST